VAVRRYQDLIAWQTGDKFKAEFAASSLAALPQTKDFRYRSQILESARSVPANIAEGFVRYSPREFVRFLGFALGSLVEAEARLRDGIQLGYFRSEDCSAAFRLARRCFTATIRLKQSQARFTD
jgi:four helix bundle protein